MEKVIVGGVILVLLALDWAALHDIIRGEPNPHLEYLMIIGSIIVFGVIYKFNSKKGRR